MTELDHEFVRKAHRSVWAGCEVCEAMHAPDPHPTLRDAWMAFSARDVRDLDDWQRECWQLMLDAVLRLVKVYDDHEFADNPLATSAADDAASLYEILNEGGLPVD